ncbi:MAG TPA: M48 family metalloprotease [Oligoflexus sp.]|uniref:M48 family metalloprotease n=1 Tax=Oligoflexus sp. TaxID=1971216 RepID=UPI002D595892|nr:M48 family metalloprotease [Oligoflexus sp.]HYX31468.1 M48 family metalloprotease [Oligoflexus sp.]
MDHIIEKNPNTFKGPYSPTAFCVQFKTNDPVLGSTSPNASANPGSGLLTFNAPVLSEVPNDASLAAVIAHELAHVTIRVWNLMW